MMSARSSTSSTFLIPALFSVSSASKECDIEAQSSSGLEHIRIPSPPAAVTRTSRARSSLEDFSNAVDDFFGAASPSFIPCCTQDSRHDAATPTPRAGGSPPPPYSHSPEPPAYTRHAEHPTLVKHLFTFGFLCPLLWVAGAFFLITPLRTPRHRQIKTKVEGQSPAQSMRRAERKWAKRCLIALCVLLLVVIAAVVTAVLVVKT